MPAGVGNETFPQYVIAEIELDRCYAARRPHSENLPGAGANSANGFNISRLSDYKFIPLYTFKRLF